MAGLPERRHVHRRRPDTAGQQAEGLVRREWQVGIGEDRTEFAVVRVIADGAAWLELQRRIILGAFFPLGDRMGRNLQDLAGSKRLGRLVDKHFAVGNHSVDERSTAAHRGAPVPVVAIAGEPVRTAGDGTGQKYGVLRVIGKAKVIRGAGSGLQLSEIAGREGDV